MKRRLYIWIIFAAVLHCSAQNDILLKKINLPFTVAKRFEILNAVEKEISVTFSYSSVIEPEEVINLKKSDWILNDLLDTIFSEKDVEYIIRGNNILLKPVSTTQINSKDVQNIYTIRGFIGDKKSRPLSYVNIYFKDISLGTVTNDEGLFELNVPDYLTDDTLIISMLGYKKEIIPLHDNIHQEVNLNLEKEYIEIQEVVIRPEEPLEIIQQVRKNIPENYDISVSNMTGFFRESTRQDTEYIALTEALISVYKTPYNSYKTDVIRLEKARKGVNVEKTELVNYIVQGSLYNHLQLDIIKYGVTFIDPEFFEFYEYKLKDKIYLDDRPVYIISFDQKEGVEYPCYKGELYIDMESMAVVKSIFTISPKGIRYANKLFIKRNSTQFKAKIQYASYEVNYRYYEDCWNLTGTKAEFCTKLRERKRRLSKGIKSEFVTISELVITEKNTTNIEKIKRNEGTSSTDVLIEQIADTDSDYWGNNNIILPEEPLLETINRFRKVHEETKKQNIVTEKPKDIGL